MRSLRSSTFVTLTISNLRVPNIGWRNLKINNSIDKWDGTPLQKINNQRIVLKIQLDF